MITGFTKGSIGESLAREFARRGYRVYATARIIESMGNLGDASPLVTLLSLDVTSHTSLAAVRDRISTDTNGTLDIIYHNADRRALVMAINSDLNNEHDGVDDEQIFATNLLSIMTANRMFSWMLVATHGKIEMTGSVSGRVLQPSQAAYNASKAALEMYARILRMELAPLGVRVVLVNTGGFFSRTLVQRLVAPPGKFSSFPSSSYC
jgi:1-acylglycerone phosphate reductase